ncbi:hypothetical protein CspHIS471_0511250 [Cutaneotrichosporon sp. HIS471]|nr:hypothetical protein CspHIS471_0511250 [Cutaneotrichosporon sp. HIS471]
MPDHTIVSAPGKVLLAGGYLVLDRNYTGLVVATSSRFFASVKPTTEPCPSGTARVRVRAGQFPASPVWSYTVSESGVEGSDVPSQKNKFIFLTLDNVLRYVQARLHATGRDGDFEQLMGGGLDIVVLADNDFYTQREQLTAAGLPARLESLASLTPFCPLPRPINQTNKTGLGSSAALVTSLVAGILSHLGLVDVTTPEGIDIVHSLAQAAHCLAQGKVGSGFDVASAVYGTHVYCRFSPAVLEPLFAEFERGEKGDAVYNVVHEGKWDQEARPLRLPRGLRLMLADVDAGTDTPSFVGRVLKWRKENPEQALAEWIELDKANRSLEQALATLIELESSPEYDAELQAAARSRVGDLKPGRISTALQSLTATIEAIRTGMRKMSASSQVPIEPPEQTRLLDACSALPGVLGGGVPGAGGYDAVWILVIDQDAIANSVQDVWGGWTEMSVSPLSSKQSDGGLVLVASADDVPGLKAALAR